MSLAIIINTKNAQQTIERALKSVHFADEIVVVDMKSTDNTVDIAKKYTSQLFIHPDVGYVEPARNFAISKAKSDWILVLDSDEMIPKSLAAKIMEIISPTATDSSDCYYLPRRNFIWGEPVKSAGWWPDYVLRLFRNGSVTWSEKIHSVPITTGSVEELPASDAYAIIHDNYQSVEEYVERMNRYTTIQAKNQAHHDLPVIDPDMLVKGFGDEFLSRMFARQGVSGGVRGVGLSFLQATSEMLVLLKAWQARGFKPDRIQPSQVAAQLDSFRKELNYWIADWQAQNSSGIKRVFWQIRRKLMI